MEELNTAIKSGKAPMVVEQLDILLKAGHNAKELLEIMIDSLRGVGGAFARGEAFIPEMLIAARAMQAGVDHIASELAASGTKRIGKLLIGTVTGDLHDVGKNLVALVLRGNGFEVVDLGVDLRVDKLLEACGAERPDMVGLSALLTTTMPAMETAVIELKKAFPGVRIMVGGAPVTQDFAERIGADAYAPDAATAAEVALKLIQQ